MTGVRGRVGGLRVASLIVALIAGRPALAQITQTDAIKTPLPQPVASAELSIVNESWAWNANTQVVWDLQGVMVTQPLTYGQFYAPPAYPQFVTGDAINLSGLFKWRKEAIDPIKDAKTGPGYLSAKCGFSAELLLVGGNCQATFGWYNVLDPASKTPPAASEIYPLISRPQDALKCVQGDGIAVKADGFCPLAWDNRGPYNLSILRWTPKTFSSGDLSQDARYQGGDVGFAMVGDPQKCPQTKFSMYEHNQRNAGGAPWVTSLIYQSTIDPNGMYIAFEDLPMSPADWKKTGTGTSTSGGADGDFNDYVVYVSRTSCPGEVVDACASKTCPKGETCELGVCKDPCADVVCAGNQLCIKGACLSLPSGAGGSGNGSAGASAGDSGGSSSTGAAGAGVADAGEESSGATPAAGAAGEDDGESPEPGTDAVGGASDGVVTPTAPPKKSSSCGYAALAAGQSPRAWSVLGLAIGLAFVRRGRRARNTRRLKAQP